MAAEVEESPSRVMIRAFVNSGIPDPEWPLDPSTAIDLYRRLERVIGSSPIHAPPAGKLGYRGFGVTHDDASTNWPRTFTVRTGVVTIKRDRRDEHWLDTTGIESLLLNEAVRHGLGRILEADGVRVNEETGRVERK